MFLLQAMIIWLVAARADRLELRSLEFLFIWFVFVVISYAVIEGSKPKEE